jgi:hypothetical protein
MCPPKFLAPEDVIHHTKLEHDSGAMVRPHAHEWIAQEGSQYRPHHSSKTNHFQNTKRIHGSNG